MAGRPDTWMPMYWGDYLRDTVDLTTAEHGAYMLLIGAYWTRGGPLADDDAKLARTVRASPKAWAAMRPTLADLFTVTDGAWHHKRIDAELAAASAGYERRAGAARARWAKQEQSTCNAGCNADTMQEQPQPQPHSPDGEESDSRRVDRKSPKAPDPVAEAQFERFWEAYPGRPGNPKKPAKLKFLTILARGVDASAVIAGARNYAVGMAGKDPQYVAHATTWLNQERWTEYQRPVSPPRRDDGFL